jgi:hypothetical protein
MANDKPNWRNEASGISTPADVGARSYPSLQFLNGQAGFKGTWREFGTFFIAADENVPNDWEKVEFISKSGETVSGSIAKDIDCTVIRMRRAWFVTDANKRTRRFPWNEYENAVKAGKARGKCQIVMAVKGLPTLVALTLTGMQSTYALSSNGWGGNARRFLYDPAAKALHAGKKGALERLPALQFCIKIGAETNAGKPVYTPVGSGDATNAVTRVVLKSPLRVVETDAEIAPHIVGRVIRESYELAYIEANEWAAAWDKPDAAANKAETQDTDEEIPF